MLKLFQYFSTYYRHHLQGECEAEVCDVSHMVSQKWGVEHGCVKLVGAAW
jgi:hypothetical protein